MAGIYALLRFAAYFAGNTYTLTFSEFNFEPRLVDSIDSMGYETPTPVQQQVIPLILQGKDIIASAQTGTGKTAAFLLPIIHKLLTTPHDEHEINCMIIVPTRELAIQISQALEGMSYFTDISSIAVYGGGDGDLFAMEKRALSTGADIVICTPGRMIAHLNMGYAKLNGLKYLVLDEADRMLDMGFYDDLMKIINKLPTQRQNLLFSATMPPKIRDLARKILHEPEEINIAISKPPERIKQLAFSVFEEQKDPLVKFIVEAPTYKSIVVFCSKKQNVKKLTITLQKAGLSADAIHSDLEQPQREQVLLNFKNRKLKILVATDIVSRGIDIDNIDLVVNYDVPHDGEDYVHRIGRTARAETDGTAVTLITPQEQRKFYHIEQLIGKPVAQAKVPEQFGAAPEYKGANGERRQGGGGGRHGGGNNRGGGGQRPGGNRGGGAPGAQQRSGDNRKFHGKPKPKPSSNNQPSP